MKRFWLWGVVLTVALPVWGAEKPAVDVRAACRTVLARQPYSPAVIQFVGNQLDSAANPLGALLQLAASATNETRMIAAQLLAESGAPVAAAPLWRLVRDDSEAVRMMAAWGLSRLHERTAIAPETAGLTDERASVRRLAAELLGKLGDTTCEPALLAALDDRDELVRWQTAAALGVCGTQNAVPRLIVCLKDDSSRVRKTAAGVLGKLGDDHAITPLSAMLEDDDWRVRVAAARALNALARADGADSAASADALLAKLHADDYAVVWAARAFGLPDDERALAALVHALISDDRTLAYHALQALIRLNITPALPLVKQHSDDPRPDVRQRVLEVCGEIGGASEVSTVVAALADADPNVELMAVTALRKLHAHAAPEVLAGKLRSPNPHVRAAAARFYGEAGQRRFAPEITNLLFDENRYVRGAAAEALGKLGDRSVIAPLIRVLLTQLANGEADADPGDVGRGVVIDARLEFASQFSGLELLEQKQTAVKVLGELRATEAVEPIIISAWRSPDPTLRAAAAYALGQIGDRRAVAPLLETLRRFYTLAPADWQNDQIIATKTDPRPSLLRRQVEREIAARCNAVWALGQLGDAAATETLRLALNDPTGMVHDAAVEALLKIEERHPRHPALASVVH